MSRGASWPLLQWPCGVLRTTVDLLLVANRPSVGAGVKKRGVVRQVDPSAMLSRGKYVG
jgi:hypothetical protein